MNILKKREAKRGELQGGSKQTKKFEFTIPKVVLIPIDELEIEESYQRRRDPVHVQEIRKKFNPKYFGIIMVSQRNGINYVADGGHRVEAVRGFVDRVPCMVWEDQDYVQECEDFEVLNTSQKSANASVLFNNSVCKGNPSAVKTAEILREYGFGYNRYNFTSKDNIVGSPAKVMFILEHDGETILRRMLNINRKAWHGISKGLSATMLDGLRTFLVDNPIANDDYLIKALSKADPSIVKARAIAHINADNIGVFTGSKANYVHIANAIRDIYNGNLPSRAKAKYAV